MKPLISIIIPVYRRVEILKTLKKNKDVFRYNPVEVIVVDCNSDGALTSEILSLRYTFLSVVRLSTGDNFNKARALNIGVYFAKAAYLFFLDADIILPKGFFTEILKKVGTSCFLTVKHVYESQSNAKPRIAKKRTRKSGLDELAYLTEIVYQNKTKIVVETNRLRFGIGSRGGPGLIILPKTHFIKIRGMNSDLEGWGWEDNDLIVRLQLATGINHIRLGKVIHLSHSDSVRKIKGNNRQQNETINFLKCLRNYDMKNLHGTYSNDLKKCKAMLSKLP